ncbi:phosphatidate cytidylyltransferase [Thermanaerosceptrum fracticalcis]|jgi:phosphatidate cytidylyltransferase|uniref:Phosphatidate cytidylyltransferase n=1 Tax=Thermanaerosceptrum fracticalcis TaxID=1712410 RepID=A0A7G6E0Y1_THEFR|nr:phosphatidate cytidylyltransferase [Thermanaerosceptrum fracticalcis]QNB45735.1 phosphatidate cytidylyltransferase [Thermanaerosceptrum fracticalcis]
MLWQRIVTAVMGIPALLYIVYLGDIYLTLVITFLTLLGIYEYGNIVRKAGWQLLTIPLWLGGCLFPLATLFKKDIASFLIFIFFMFCFMYYLYSFPKSSPSDLAITLLGVLYVSWTFTHLILLRQLNYGFWLVLFVFIIIWSTDTGAYFTGVYFGKRKFAPSISPNKTWEGFFGGLLFSVLGAYLLIRNITIPHARYLLLMAPVISLAGQIGDLFESSIKRTAHIKDSSRIIPGHGGILDRFDSTLWAAPLTYYLIVLMGWR